MTHIGLFEGIGGFSLAAHWAGWETLAWCEIDPFCQRVLSHYWPNAEKFTDIKQSDFTKYANKIDVLTGGFPCQPFSSAGERRGTDDPRHLWPEMLRVVREIRPRYVVGENVDGLVNWSGGMVFDQVQADLENEGYEVIPVILPACGVGAPHRRYRVWFIAYCSNTGAKGLQQGWEDTVYGFKSTAHANSVELQGRSEPGILRASRPDGNKRLANMGRVPDWETFPTKPPVRGGNDGIPGKLDGITISGWARESIKAFGNAIVPQVAYQIFQAINEYESRH